VGNSRSLVLCRGAISWSRQRAQDFQIFIHISVSIFSEGGHTLMTETEQVSEIAVLS
jgi:hypothetical protein